MSTKTLLYPYALALLCLCLCFGATAQLQANFTMDKPGGCSPLSVQFTNTTTGGSATTTYQWTFGNGNSSTKKDPGASYYDEKTYTVTLTAKDGATTNTTTQQVTVYKKPTVDFGVSPAKGCVPLPTTFTANATAGDGTISKYYWDFGDGGTEQGTIQGTSHTYTFPQKPPTSLTVTNSYGCYTTSTKNGLVEAVKGVVANFTPSPSALCKAGDEVIFTNTSTGSGTLTYIWDFGDGKTSTEQSPKHAYTTKGSYTVKLNVKSSDGCNLDATPVVMNVANFVADFEVLPHICQNQQTDFKNTSTAGFNNIEWLVDGYNNGYFYNNILNYTFFEAGEHTIKQMVTYGVCSVENTKKINVNPTPQPYGFISEIQGACGVPVTFNFKDTTKEAVKWEWNYSYSPFSTAQSSSYTFTQGDYAWIYLKVTNKEGCTGAVEKYVYYTTPSIDIHVRNIATDNYWINDCTGMTGEFFADQDSIIKDYKWIFGDGTTSTERRPKHTYNNAGSFPVSLEYTTNAGCKGTKQHGNIIIVDKPKFDVAIEGSTTVCGNTPTVFNTTPSVSGWTYNYFLNDNYAYTYGWGPTLLHQFAYDTTYTLKVIAYNGNCADTIIKKDYIKVLPPFPKIQQHLRTCDDTRGLVKFADATYKAQTWNWDFGDGSSPLKYATQRDTAEHLYTKTGSYKVVLSTTYGPCTVKDSVSFPVLLKQSPVLTTLQTEACGSGTVNFELKNFELNPSSPEYDYDFRYSAWDAVGPPDFSLQYIYGQSFEKGTTISIDNLPAGITKIRLVTLSYNFICYDTSNFVSIKIKGPAAGFKVNPHSGCFRDPVVFTDTSKIFFTSKIVKWEWDFGDGQKQTLTTAGSTSHTYSTPGYFYVRLKVTDSDGCTNESGQIEHPVEVSGPKADFSPSSYNVAPNTLVNFTNTSQGFGYYSSDWKWFFPDGSTSTEGSDLNFLFTDEGRYDVKLTSYTAATGCTDTVVKTITIRKVNSAFTYTLSYINNNSCPPVMARFNSISANAVRLGWDFGDGGVGGDQQVVSHTYNAAGLYRVVHYSYDANNAVDSTEDFIEIKGPYALLKADTLYACNTLQVKLSAEVKYAKDYTWDFGDGTLVAGTDTFATHDYLTPGIYIPALILKDEGGCTTTSQLPEKIIVDSLSAEFSTVPAAVCNAATVVFTPQTRSLSADNLQTVLQYRWVISESNASDTLHDQFASRNFSLVGEHNIALRVTSPYGCVADATGKVDVKPGVAASIAGPLQICKNEPVTFTGKATPASNTLQWTWNFGNAVSNVQNPAAQVFTTAGQQAISLIVSNGNCADTANFTLSVQEAPIITISPAQPILCLGDSMNLTATAATGTTFQWSPTTFIQNANTASATVWPSANKFYKVKVTNAAGCASTDSVGVKVIAPFQLTAKSPLFACAGNTVQLNATGADKYIWQNGTGLSNSNIANPIATTTTATNYTVVGYDNYNCFTDTAIVAVKIGKLPTVNAGSDYQIIAGSQVKLASTNSSDVTKWKWNPADYLTCATCPSPTSTPKATTVYELTVYTAEGCVAKDTVRVELICKSELVYIPTGFTPNGDNLNDRFAIHGSGIKTIRHIVVFDRWGKAVFERKNTSINDRNSSWDGKYNSEPAPSAAYIYMVEVECDGGDLFTYKGTVTLVR